MKSKTKKLFLSLFAFVGLSLAACGGGGSSSTDSGSSSGGSDSSERSSREPSSSEEESSEEESSEESSEEVSTTYTARLTSGTISASNVVLVHVWGAYGADTVEGSVNGSIVSFTLDSTDYNKFIVCELKPGADTLGENWVNVAKQSRECEISDSQVDFVWKPLADDNYHLWGTTDGTNWDELGKFTATAGVYSTTVNLVKGTEFVFHLETFTAEDPGWRNFADLIGTGVAGNFLAKGGTGTDANNIIVNTTGSYTFTVTNEHKVQVGDSAPISSTHVLHIKRGTTDTPIDLVANPGNEGELMKTDVELQAGDSLYIDMGNDDWRHYSDLNTTSGAGMFFEEDTGDNGNFRVIAGKGGSYDFYVNLNKGSGNSIFVSRDRDGTETTTEYPAALGTDFGGTHVVYVHAWGVFGSETYALTDLTKLPVKSDVSQFVLVSFAPGTTEFDWDEKLTQTTDVTPEAVPTATFTIDTVGDTETKTTWHWAGGTVHYVNYLDLYRGTENTKTELVAKSTEEYKVVDVALQVGDVLSFCINISGTDNWAKFDNVKDGGSIANFKSHVAEDLSNGNIEVKTAGTYNFYVENKSTGGSAKTIWISNSTDRTGWKAVVGTEEREVFISTSDDNEIYIQNVELAAGDKIIFKNTAKSLEQGFAQIKDDCPSATFFEAGASNELTVKTGQGGTYDFYIDLSIAKGVWIQKHVPTVNHSVTISGSSWVFSDSPDFFANCKDGDGHEKNVLLVETSTAGVYTLGWAEVWTPTEMKVYRCKPGGTAPHADESDTPGKVWNTSNKVSWTSSMTVTIS